jgi:TonB-dependent starch-binding outer membrane protein SusC
LSVSGGTETSTYASSISYFSQQGIIGGDRSQFDRISGRLNTRHQVNSNFNFGSNIAYSHIIQRGIASNQSFNSAYSSALNLDPLTPLYEQDEQILNTFPYSTEPVVTSARDSVRNFKPCWCRDCKPLALMEIQTGRNRSDKIVGNVFGELEIIEGLNFNSSLGIDLAYVLNDSHTPIILS